MWEKGKREREEEEEKKGIRQNRWHTRFLKGERRCIEDGKRKRERKGEVVGRGGGSKEAIFKEP